jgi:hypothetical protein
MRLRGFSLMTNILDDYAKELDVISLVRLLDCLNLLFLIMNHVVGSRVYAYMALTAQEQGRGLKGLRARQLICSI